MSAEGQLTRCESCGHERECATSHADPAQRVLCAGCASRAPSPTAPLASLHCLQSSSDVLGRSREVGPHRSREVADLGLLDEFTTSAEWAVRAAGLWGRRTTLGEDFPCPIPGHQAHGCSAALVTMPDGRILMLDTFHEGGSGTKAYTLASVHAQVTAGRHHRVRGAASVAWLYRLAAEVGFMELPEIVAPLPDLDLADEERRQLDGLLLLLRVRQAAGELGRVAPPFARSFRMDWTGASEFKAQTAWSSLTAVGAIHAAGSCIIGKRSAATWLPVPYSTPAELFERPPLRLVRGVTA